jgi:hypothetical protein
MNIFTTTHKATAAVCVATVFAVPVLFGSHIPQWIDDNMPRPKDLLAARREYLKDELERTEYRKQHWAVFSGRPFTFGRFTQLGGQTLYALQKQTIAENSGEVLLEKSHYLEQELSQKH